MRSKKRQGSGVNIPLFYNSEWFDMNHAAMLRHRWRHNIATFARVSSEAGLTLADKTLGSVNTPATTATRDLQTVRILAEWTLTHTQHNSEATQGAMDCLLYTSPSPRDS